MFMSWQLTGPQTRWHTTEREAFAVYKAVQECAWLITGVKHPLTVYTDHSALTSVLKMDDPTGRICRWQLYLQRFAIEYVHVAGKSLAVADGLSQFNNVAATELESSNTKLLAHGYDGESDEEMDIVALHTTVVANALSTVPPASGTSDADLLRG